MEQKDKQKSRNSKLVLPFVENQNMLPNQQYCQI